MIDSDAVLSKKEKEELVLDLYFEKNKTYSEIAKIARMSPRDIKPIIDKAFQEKERKEHKSLFVQAYELFSKRKTPLEVAIVLNIGEHQATQYYTEYLRLVHLCKAAKAERMKVQHVIILLKIANNRLPSVQHRYEMLQKQNNELQSILRTQAKEFQFLSNQITFMNNRLDDIKSECENETATLQRLRQQAAKLQAFVNHFKNDNNGEYIKVIKAVKDEVQKNLSNVKPLLDMAIFSVISL
jgi:hypothetical protein